MTVDAGDVYWRPDLAELLPLFGMDDHDEMTGALPWADEEERAERRRRAVALSALARVNWPRPDLADLAAAGHLGDEDWRGVAVPHRFVAGTAPSAMAVAGNWSPGDVAQYEATIRGHIFATADQLGVPRYLLDGPSRA